MPAHAHNTNNNNNNNNNNNEFTLTMQKGIHMSTWMTGKNSMKHHCQRKKNFTVTKTWKVWLLWIANVQKELGKIFR